MFPTQKEDLIKSILASNDSAPGPDGIPYAAWRLHPGTSAEAMTTHFDDICRAAVPHAQYKHGFLGQNGSDRGQFPPFRNAVDL